MFEFSNNPLRVSWKTAAQAHAGSLEAAAKRLTCVDEIEDAALGGWLADTREFEREYHPILRRKGRRVRPV